MSGLLSGVGFMPHGHCYLWIPSLLWLHFSADLLIGLAYIGISVLLYLLVRRLRLPFSPVFVAFGLFIGLCGGTHLMAVWTIWNPDYWADGLLKGATAIASVATAVGLLYIRPQIDEFVHAARLSEERRVRLETANAELEALYARVTELDELKSRFFANVSHELRTPLALILGPAQHMQGDDNLSAEQRRRLEGIEHSGKLLLKQVNDLLDVARLEADRLEVHYARSDAAALSRLIAGRFEVAAERRGLDLRVETPAELEAELDPELFERMLLNLLSNAFKFTPAGGSVRLSLAERGEELELVVADSGPGIAPEQRGLVFERFRQAEGAADRRHGGTGLGLALVKDFVELHGGTISLDQAAEGGARFTLRLPRRAPEGARVAEQGAALTPGAAEGLEGALQELAPEPQQQSWSAAGGERAEVLVVEDHPELRRFLGEVLGAHYNVVTAEDGAQALERAQAQCPDLVLTDVMMPGMSGDALVRALRAQTAFATVPIVVLTARADEQLRVELLRAGAQDYLAKPVQPEELLARVGNLLAAKRAGDALRTQLASVSTDLEGLAAEVAAKNRQLSVARDGAQVAREQAERAARTKSHFLGMVSHELRTPLSSILLNLQLLERRGGLRPDTQPQLTRLMAAARQMSALVEGLLEYTRLESGRLAVRREPVDVAQLAAEAVEARQDELGGRPLQLELDAAPGPAVQTDPRLLRVVLENLLGNALKFTEQGRITVHVRHHTDGCRVAVSDTGPGIAAQDLERIFLPFEQLEPIQRKSIPGIGLGLALVRQVVEVLGGSLKVESQEGHGSRFAVELPKGG